GPLTPAHPIAEGLVEHPEIWERQVDEYRARRSENDKLNPRARAPRDSDGCPHLFANLIAAYEGLSPKIRALIDDLQAVHQTSDYDGGGHARVARRDGRSTGPFVSLHPLVRIHPETGEKLLF